LALRENEISIAQLILSIYQRDISKDAIMPKYSHEILSRVFDDTIMQYMELRKKDSTIDPLSVIETLTTMNIKMLRRTKSPVILLRNIPVDFTTKKDSPFTIAVIQPKFPRAEDFLEKKNLSGEKLLLIKDEVKKEIIEELKGILISLQGKKVDFACFPELSFVNHPDYYTLFAKWCKENDCFIIAGSYHNETELDNSCVIFLPTGEKIVQKKIFKATCEGIIEKPIEYLNFLHFSGGSFCVLICIDSEREPIRAVLKERLSAGDCPTLVFNPSYTEHPDRPIGVLAENLMILLSTAIVFCNCGQYGGSTVLFPRKDLKEKGFRLFALAPSTETSIEKVEINLSELSLNRIVRQPDLVSNLE
jgi:hypothetical protein